MSTTQYARVWDSFQGPALEKLAALAIADWADDDGCAVVTAIELSAKLRVTHPEAVEVIGRLMKRGFLVQTSHQWFQIHQGGE